MKYKAGYKYQVTEGFTVQTGICSPIVIITRFLTLETDGELTVRAGYAWDGASGPTLDKEIGWGWFKIKLTDTQVPSCVHDALAQLMRQQLLNRAHLPHVNELLYSMLEDRGMSWPRRRLWQRGLELTGGSFADPENAKEIFEAF